MGRRARALVPALLLLSVLTAPAAADHVPVVLAACAGPSGLALLDPGTGVRTRQVATDYASAPDVSPDGRRLALVDSGLKYPQLALQDLDGGVRRQVEGSYGFAAPDWSPDGRTVAGTVDDGTTRRVVVVDATAPAPAVRTVPGTEGASEPSWSPDGAFLVFASAQGLVTVRPDGGDRTVLAVPDGSEPAWSPDGREIAFRSTRDGSVAAVALPGLARRTLVRPTSPATGYRLPAWSPDGQRVYVQQEPAAGGQTVRRVVRLDARAPGAGPDTGFRAPADSGCPSLGGGHRPAPDPSPPGATSLRLTPLASRLAVEAGLPSGPDVAGFVLRYAPGDVAPATPQSGLDGGRSLLGRTLVTRLAAGTTYSVSAWAVDWSGATGPRATATATTRPEVLTSLTVTPPVATVVAGSRVVLEARLLREDDGRPLANAPVELYARHTGGRDVLVTRLRTDAAGRVSSQRQPLASTRYTLRFRADNELLASSDDSLVLVQPQVSAALSRASVARGAAVSVRVQTRPARAGLSVRVTQRDRFGRTVLTRLGRTDARGAVRLPLRTTAAGAYGLAVDTGAGAGFAPRSVAGPTLRVR